MNDDEFEHNQVNRGAVYSTTRFNEAKHRLERGPRLCTTRGEWLYAADYRACPSPRVYTLTECVEVGRRQP